MDKNVKQHVTYFKDRDYLGGNGPQCGAPHSEFSAFPEGLALRGSVKWNYMGLFLLDLDLVFFLCFIIFFWGGGVHFALSHSHFKIPDSHLRVDRYGSSMVYAISLN